MASSKSTSHESPDQEILYQKAEVSSKWSNIKDLDFFFRKLYVYHQKRGFWAIVLSRILELANYVFVVLLTTYLFHGIEYSVLFDDVPRNNPLAGSHSQDKLSSSYGKVTLFDAILPLNECIIRFNGLTIIVLGILSIVWLLFFVKRLHEVVLTWDIKQFYHSVLDVYDNDLADLTWKEIQKKIIDAQTKIPICVIKKQLTDVDIYQRILRRDNILKGFVQQGLLPPKIHLPFLPEIVYWTTGLEVNIRLLLFHTRWSVFKNSWEIHEEYRKPEEIFRAAGKLKTTIVVLALINIAFLPLIFCWQGIYGIFSYGELLKREPGAFNMRCWSKYSKLLLRHYNEFHEELHIRLCRAHGPVTKYLSTFTRPILIEIAKHIGFISGSLFVILIGLVIYDEDVMKVEHVLTCITILGICTATCRSIIPDETQIDDPERLLKQVVEHTHHEPYSWSNTKYPSRKRDMGQILQLYQMRAVAILEWLLSPLLNPILLLFWVYPRSIEIVDFFNRFIVYHKEIGDVCSFAMSGKNDGIPDKKEPFEMSEEFIPEDTVDVKISIPVPEYCGPPPTTYISPENSAEVLFKKFENVSKCDSNINTKQSNTKSGFPSMFSSKKLIVNLEMSEKKPLLY